MALRRAKYINAGYVSDLDVWKKSILPWISKYIEPHEDNGLYTGETILHMATVNGDAKFVRYLLDKDADYSSQITGQFFKPLVTRRGCSRQRTWWERLMLFLRIHDIDDRCGDLNTESGLQDADVYLGQYPLSLAACTGYISVCNELKRKITEKIEKTNTPAPSQGNASPWSGSNSVSLPVSPICCQMSTSSSQSVTSNDGCATEENEASAIFDNKFASFSKRTVSARTFAIQHPEWRDFVNLKDDFGNTALHIAVMHEQTAMVDWLVAHEADMTIMNNQGLTPFTERVVGQSRHVQASDAESADINALVDLWQLQAAVC
jgi:ankyrin repeat protein